ncbi:hypothetical protein C1645_735110 [Glomus cerebriforme]|uniref:Uncharacterized protein n=1 Tax=Glomus cerebriforme TaxID=658196 RepID=A0A397T722_9GLOM|nr:hypothetical protein C1645_735110 [Glomus cerebriforme]
MGLMAKDNGKIEVESANAREIYSIMKKMDNVKTKITMRRKGKIQNINYIERLLQITEKANIFWSLKESKKEKKSKKKGNNDKLIREIIEINELEEILPINKYRLYWNRNLVNDKIREMVKKYNKFKYIEKWLTLKVNKNIMKNVDKNEIEWEKMLEYILNRKEGGYDITSEKDLRDRIYNIKNLIEKLPTYSVME